jgi:hypothetical protein
MRDRNLERNIQRVEATIESWKQFSQFLDRCFKGYPFAAEEEVSVL